MFWGAQEISFDTHDDVKVRFGQGDSVCHVISNESFTPSLSRFTHSNNETSLYSILECVFSLEFTKEMETRMTDYSIQNCISLAPTVSCRPVDFESIAWKPLPVSKGTTPVIDPIDECFTSGHCLYRLSFDLETIPVNLKMNLNIRHRCVVLINDKVFGGHLSYSLGIFRVHLFPNARLDLKTGLILDYGEAIRSI